MAKAQLVHAFNAARTELHDVLGLTGCEVSINTMPPQVETPFIHYHEQNEEVYVVLEGKGQVWLDGDVTDIAAGDCFRVVPAAHRCLRAGAEGLRYICIQAREGSLVQFTMGDGKLVEGQKTSW